MTKKHLSISQINTYLRCPLQYYFRYIQGIIIPPKAALVLGGVIHKTLEYNYKQKVKSCQDLKVKEILEYFDWTFKEREKEVEWKQENEKKEKFKEQGMKLLEKYQNEIAPKIQPLVVEQKHEIQLEGLNRTFLAFLDLIDIHQVIIDHKTSARTPSIISPDHNLQLIAYSMTYRAENEKQESKSRVHYLIKTQEPKIIALEKKVSNQEIQRFLKIISSVARAIEEENFYPNPHNFMCTAIGCGFWEICHKTF
jgi:CRISPR/Cas system-associated exonuclease Cas4 (RecB family)